ncbi:hypothetical protein EDD11_004543 [Mortierella claussenii]|nr:hypothetical protein EDD11_004543 [Mortierella claussenii]
MSTLNLASAARSLQQKQPSRLTSHAMPYSTSSDPSLSPFARTVIATTRVVRNLLLISTSTLALGYFFWSGTHAYLEEYKCPSPKGISNQARQCLHGAWIREEISPDPDVAELYLQSALDMVRKDLQAAYRKKYQNAGATQEAIMVWEMEQDQALVEIQNRMARFYSRLGRDAEAATMWTRLWKLVDLPDPRSAETSSSSSSSSKSSVFAGLSGLFGGNVDRPLVTKEDAAVFAKQAADCWMRLGEYDLAEEALVWTLSTVTSDNIAGAASPQMERATNNKNNSSNNSTSSIEEVGLLSTLGALYVHRAKFEYALSLFVRALQLVQEHRAQFDSALAMEPNNKKESNSNDMWYCREAILMNSIGETLFGAATATTTTAGPKEQEKNQFAEEIKNSSSWKFWSSSSTSASSHSPKSATSAAPAVSAAAESPEQKKKEEEALGWIQKAIAMAKDRSGKHRDCDECAALGLNTLGLIHEMNNETEVALQQFREAVLYATKADDYVGLEDYNKNLVRLTDKIAAASKPDVPLLSSSLPSSTSSVSPPPSSSA